MDLILPIIVQHARELAEAQIAPTETEHYKIATPLPVGVPDPYLFRDVLNEDLAFADPQTDADGARTDVWKALDFFARNDKLVLDFSYGIVAEDESLSRVCEKFYSDGTIVPKATPAGAAFGQRLSAMSESFRHNRHSLSASQGDTEFRYTYYSPIQWTPQTLDSDEIVRLQQKTLDVYGALDVEPSRGRAELDALLAQVKSVSLCYSKLQYELGSFEILRDWVDPELFDSDQWSFADPNDVLVGDPTVPDNIGFMYATRLYVVRNYFGTPREYSGTTVGGSGTPDGGRGSSSSTGPIVRDHRGSTPDGGGVSTSSTGPIVRDHRRP